MSARVRRAALVVLAAASLLLATACPGGEEEATPTPTPTEVVPDPTALLREAADRMATVERFHFLLEHVDGTSEIVRGIEMVRAEGDIGGTELLQAEIEGRFGTLTFETAIVVLPDQGWLQNPLTRRWEREDITVSALFDPQQGAVALMRTATATGLGGREHIGDIECWIVEGVDRLRGAGVLPERRGGAPRRRAGLDRRRRPARAPHRAERADLRRRTGHDRAAARAEPLRAGRGHCPAALRRTTTGARDGTAEEPGC